MLIVRLTAQFVAYRRSTAKLRDAIPSAAATVCAFKPILLELELLLRLLLELELLLKLISLLELLELLDELELDDELLELL